MERGSKDLICPFHQKAMHKVCHKCPLWVKLRGTNPNTGQEVDNWSCSLGVMPVLMVENSQQQRSTGAAVESFRNEMVKMNEVGTHLNLVSDNDKKRIT
jgi:succinyl-CoA synthetase beta subunit